MLDSFSNERKTFSEEDHGDASLLDSTGNRQEHRSNRVLYCYIQSGEQLESNDWAKRIVKFAKDITKQVTSYHARWIKQLDWYILHVTGRLQLFTGHRMRLRDPSVRVIITKCLPLTHTGWMPSLAVTMTTRSLTTIASKWNYDNGSIIFFLLIIKLFYLST